MGTNLIRGKIWWYFVCSFAVTPLVLTAQWWNDLPLSDLFSSLYLSRNLTLQIYTFPTEKDHIFSWISSQLWIFSKEKKWRKITNVFFQSFIHPLMVCFFGSNFTVDFLISRFKIISLIDLSHSFHFIVHQQDSNFAHFKITLIVKSLTGQDQDTFDWHRLLLMCTFWKASI